MFLVASAQQAADLPAWLTILLSLVTGLSSGVIGALIAARTQRAVARGGRRDTAQHALWSYHRVLHDWSEEMEARATHDTPRYTKSDSDKLNAARDAAYPYRSYLAKDKQDLIARNWVPDWREDRGAMGVSEDFYDWAKELETELDRVFGKDDR